MTTEEMRQNLNKFCYGHADCAKCPHHLNEFCTKYSINDAEEGIIKKWYELFFNTEPTTPVIKDSGERRQFGTGAVRDIQEGKGRCDLMPLDVIGEITGDPVIVRIADFVMTGDRGYLKMALDEFRGDDPFKDVPTMLLEVAKHFENGAKKYGENNWQKGIPVRCYIDSAVRHYLKYLRNDPDEPHHRAFCWNILCAIWTCKHKPELNDYGHQACPVCNTVIPDGEGECPHCRMHVADPDWDVADYEEENQ